MKHTLFIFFFFGFGIVVSCQKDGVPPDLLNSIDNVYFGYRVYFGPAPVLDVTDQGYADLFPTYDLDGNLIFQFISYGGIDPNSGGEAYYPSQTYYGRYWKVGKNVWHQEFSAGDTLFVTKNRKFPLDLANGDWSCAEGGAPSWETRRSITLTAITAPAASQWVLIRYAKVGWFRMAADATAYQYPDVYYGDQPSKPPAEVRIQSSL